MQTPSRSEPVPASIRRSKRIIRIAQSIPEVSGPVSTYEAVVTSFENNYNARVLARNNASIALGNQHEAEAALDAEIRGVGLILLRVGRGRRDTDGYHRYFPNGYGEALRRSPEKAIEVTSGILAQMDAETNAKILSIRDDLVAAKSALEAAVAAYHAATNVLGQARALLQDEKLAWRKAHFDFYHAMRSALFDRRSYVDSIFKVGDRTQPDSGAQATGDTPAKADGAGSAPAPAGLTVVVGESAPGVAATPSTSNTSTASCGKEATSNGNQATLGGNEPAVASNLAA